MLEVLPGIPHSTVRDRLAEASRAATVPINAMTAVDSFNEYGVWAATQAAALGLMVAPAEVDRLITTRRYWEMQGRNPVDYGPALRTIVQSEMFARKAALDRELEQFDANVTSWGETSLAVVPDTSVFVQLGGTFPEYDWHAELDLRPDVVVTIVVTMAVVAELDGKKLSKDSSAHGKKVTSGVKAALRRMEELFPTNNTQEQFIRWGDLLSFTVTALLTDAPNHVRQSDPDAEIISRGLSLLPYTKRVKLVTYDLSQAFRARAAGLESKRMIYPDESSRTQSV